MANDHVTLIVFNGEYDRAMSALTIANGAAGAGQTVTIFFTFWGLCLLRRQSGKAAGLLQRTFKRMMPCGPFGLSHFNFGGLGPLLLRRLIRRQQGQTLTDLLRMAMDRGVYMVACEATMKMLGITREELVAYDRLSIGNVHDFLRSAGESRVCLLV